MSTTTDLVAAAVLFGPFVAGSAACAWSLRGHASDSAAVRQVLADHAAERAASGEDGGGTDPDREPAPDTVPAPVARLATVLPFPTTTAHARRAA
ncbi:hypothetical protein GCM10010495_15000 [Kitasatospora herbaricolor]|uniref:hypothetical protein n=1 Tax=Kitasatospora herbaricolor TaxID=68217 RepID=UPI00174BB37E|nr:hypothetical protein [Kitasatospora herbaricolor]MDQ0309302.1 hypothetical protein [Kitasatospora herbaricolor]GGV04284.1 hypothetical protein GCM10010495_15000 [Kitasatospora herbaricolor]